MKATHEAIPGADPRIRRYVDPTEPEAADEWVQREIGRIQTRAERQARIWEARAKAAQRVLPPHNW